MFGVLIAAVVLLSITYIIRANARLNNYPPGPQWLPIVGNLPLLKKLSKECGSQHHALEQLAKKFNTNVLGLKLGRDYVVTVFSYQTVRNVLLGEEYEGRPDNFFIKLRCMGTRKGVTCTDGPIWKSQRTFVTTHLRHLGLGKTYMDQIMKEEILETLNILSTICSDVQIGKIVAPAVINVLWALTSGSKIDRKDPRLHKLLELLDLRSKAFDMSGGTLSHHPWLRFVAPEKSGFNLISKLNGELRDLLLETINYHYKTWEEGRDDDLIYRFIGEMKQENGKQYFTEHQLIMVCLDIFIAGSQTTSNTLDFAFLAMILHPELQRKVHSCIDQAFDKDEEINYSDRQRVPYVQAVLLEVQRYFTIAPISGPRRVLKNTVLEGFYIPKDTTVLISLQSVHFDKNYWKDPEVFRPERFLNDKGELLQNQDRVIPFGLGKRRCLGEVLAKNFIYSFFVSVLRKYEVRLLPGHQQLTGIPVQGITQSPESYRAQFCPR